MDGSSQREREVRAARNEALFRRVNEKLEDLNETLNSVSETFVIACECADLTCVEMLDISREEYEAVRESPHRFVVLPAHVQAGVERVVDERDGYVVVEKLGAAAGIAEAEAHRIG